MALQEGWVSLEEKRVVEAVGGVARPGVGNGLWVLA